MFKQIIKGKAGFFCDVCGVEIPIEEKVNILLHTWFKDNHIELCSKHGKQIKEFVEKLKHD